MGMKSTHRQRDYRHRKSLVLFFWGENRFSLSARFSVAPVFASICDPNRRFCSQPLTLFAFGEQIPRFLCPNREADTQIEVPNRLPFSQEMDSIG